MLKVSDSSYQQWLTRSFTRQASTCIWPVWFVFNLFLAKRCVPHSQPQTSAHAKFEVSTNSRTSSWPLTKDFRHFISHWVRTEGNSKEKKLFTIFTQTELETKLKLWADVVQEESSCPTEQKCKQSTGISQVLFAKLWWLISFSRRLNKHSMFKQTIFKSCP